MSLPRARGWTGDQSTPPSRAIVSSAYARVDRPVGWPRAATACLFRVRAGGPYGGKRGGARGKSLPRTRGWTDECAVRLRLPEVSSAYARVDRHGLPCTWSGGRLFRVRAGGPAVDYRGLYKSASLPRTRGWTVGQMMIRVDTRVSTACARVVRGRAPAQRRGCRLYRVRAGGPDFQTPYDFWHGSLPRARGWTHFGDGHRSDRKVSSAYARVN